jgi:hypothetical protein
LPAILNGLFARESGGSVKDEIVFAVGGRHGFERPSYCISKRARFRIKSAKGAARAAVVFEKHVAPHSVLRVFFKRTAPDIQSGEGF